MFRPPSPCSVTEFRPRAVFARHAASLLVVRHGAAGPEVLMGVRGAGHRFMPNRLVFPGGAVDPADRAAAAAAEPSPALLAALGRHARPPLARAIAMAAARELAEETGLSLGTPPRLDRMAPVCRAITPPRSPIRFNARFLWVPADATVGTPHDTHELLDVRYRPVADALALDLLWVTRGVLERLLACLAAPAGAAAPGPWLLRGERWRVE